MIPEIHAQSSIKRWGGNLEDFEKFREIHAFMDSSKACISDNRHRVLTHNSWFVVNVLPKLFGDIIEEDGKFVRSELMTLSTGRKVPVKDVGEWHCIEDFRGFIPTPQDYVEHLELTAWMNNGLDKPNRFKNKKEVEQTKVID